MSDNILRICGELNDEEKKKALRFAKFIKSQRKPETLYDYQEEVTGFSCDMTYLKNLIEVLENNYFSYDSEYLESDSSKRAVFAVHYSQMQTLVYTIRKMSQEMTAVIKELSDISLEALEPQRDKNC